MRVRVEIDSLKLPEARAAASEPQLLRQRLEEGIADALSDVATAMTSDDVAVLVADTVSALLEEETS